MDKDNVFDNLVKDLSSDEKRKMIEKMEENIHVSQEPMGKYVENEPVHTIEEEYRALSWLEKLIIFFQSLFSGKDKLELTEKHVIRSIARQITTINPGLIDIKTKVISQDFCEKLKDILESANFIKNPLSVCFGIDKVKFYSLLGQLEFQHIHDSLKAAVDFQEIARKSPHLDGTAIRKKVTDDTEALLAQISIEDRKRMMETTRTLNTLYQISIFPYQQIISQFPYSPEGIQQAAGFSDIKESLSEFAHILKSFKTAPSIKLLEAVFLLYFSTDKDNEQAIDEKISESIKRCETLFQKIRNFNNAIPLSDLMKVIMDDPFYSISSTGSGEDWFYFYRQFWMDTLSEHFRIYTRDQKIETVSEELQRYWDLSEFSFIPAYKPQDKYSVFAYSMGALNTFYTENYQKKLYYPMKIILVDGSFYKKNNRIEYENTFQILVKFAERIKWFSKKLTPQGEVSQNIRNTSHEHRQDHDELDRKILSIYINLNRDAQLILEDAISCLTTMGKLMNGVVMGNGGSYDTISNFSELGGRSNEELRQSVTEAADDIHKISHGLQDLFLLEKEKMLELTKKERQ